MNGDLKVKLDKYYLSRKHVDCVDIVKYIEALPFKTRVQEANAILEQSNTPIEKYDMFRRFDSGIIMELYRVHLASGSNSPSSWDVIIDAFTRIKAFTLQERLDLLKPILGISHPMIKSSILSALESLLFKANQKAVLDLDFQTQIFALATDCVNSEDSEWLKELAKSIIEDDATE